MGRVWGSASVYKKSTFKVSTFNFQLLISKFQAQLLKFQILLLFPTQWSKLVHSLSFPIKVTCVTPCRQQSAKLCRVPDPRQPVESNTSHVNPRVPKETLYLIIWSGAKRHQLINILKSLLVKNIAYSYSLITYKM